MHTVRIYVDSKTSNTMPLGGKQNGAVLRGGGGERYWVVGIGEFYCIYKYLYYILSLH